MPFANKEQPTTDHGKKLDMCSTEVLVSDEEDSEVPITGMSLIILNEVSHNM